MYFCDKIKRIMAFDVKITTKISILDLIMPYTCRGCGRLGELLCGRCKNYIIQPEMRDGWIVAVGRREGVLMRLVEDYKYKSVRKTAGVLAELMDAALQVAAGPVGLRPSASQGAVTADASVVVVPLPTIAKHIRERGFDHTLKLAKALARRHKDWECRSLLVRANKTVQVGSNAETRKKQAAAAYELAPDAVRMVSGKASGGGCDWHGSHGRLPADKTYLLVDDVSTTGASLKAAREILRRAGAKKIFGAVVCIGLND